MKGDHLSRRQLIAVLEAPKKRSVIKALADRFCISEDFISYVRRKNKWMLSALKDGRL